MEIAGRSLRYRLIHAAVFSIVIVGLDVLEAGWPPPDWSGLAAGPLFFVAVLVGDVLWQSYLDA